MSGQLPWYQYPNLIFRHPIVVDGEFFSSYSLDFKDLFESIENKKIHQAVCELYPQTSKIIKHEYCTEMEKPLLEFQTSTLYINTNNGHTELLKNETINSEANKLITFKTLTPYRESTCTDKNKLLIKITYE